MKCDQVDIYNLGPDFQQYAKGLAKALELGNVANRWILARANAVTQASDECFKAYKFGDFITGVYRFWTEDMCADYLENMKPVIKNGHAAKEEARLVLPSCTLGRKLQREARHDIYEDVKSNDRRRLYVLRAESARQAGNVYSCLGRRRRGARRPCVRVGALVLRFCQLALQGCGRGTGGELRGQGDRRFVHHARCRGGSYRPRD